jgi:hypothetical protein
MALLYAFGELLTINVKISLSHRYRIIVLKSADQY